MRGTSPPLSDIGMLSGIIPAYAGNIELLSKSTKI